MNFTLPRGMRDLEPEDADYYETIRQAFTETCRIYGFKLMEPSPIEMLSTLEAKSGEAIRNEIYYFKDKSDRDVGLRFDLTVGIARYLCSKREIKLPAKVGSFASMFRYDEPQYGRYRWFYQWDAEIFGPKNIDADAEVIDFTSFLLKKLGLKDTLIKIGDRRIAESFIRNSLRETSTSSIMAMLRLLDKSGKRTREEILKEGMEKGIKSDKLSALLDFASIKGNSKTVSVALAGNIATDGLELLNIYDMLQAKGVSNIELNVGIVRGLDYYSGIVFEAYDGSDSKLGALAGGGRYDALPAVYGRSELGATGVAGGIERTVLAMKKTRGLKIETAKTVFVAVADSKLKAESYLIVKTLRENNIAAETDLADRSLRKQYEAASSRGSKIVILVAPNEFSRGEVLVKDLETGKETAVQKNNLADTIAGMLKL
ncbi:MAG: histidine--tRNA ligase [Thaumarchaeota archaeon]|nr:histidine--tRNA ligase [Nitrososphaerota archaeon]